MKCGAKHFQQVGFTIIQQLAHIKWALCDCCEIWIHSVHVFDIGKCRFSTFGWFSSLLQKRSLRCAERDGAWMHNVHEDVVTLKVDSSLQPCCWLCARWREMSWLNLNLVRSEHGGTRERERVEVVGNEPKVSAQGFHGQSQGFLSQSGSHSSTKPRARTLLAYILPAMTHILHTRSEGWVGWVVGSAMAPRNNYNHQFLPPQSFLPATTTIGIFLFVVVDK